MFLKTAFLDSTLYPGAGSQWIFKTKTKPLSALMMVRLGELYSLNRITPHFHQSTGLRPGSESSLFLFKNCVIWGKFHNLPEPRFLTYRED